MKVASTTPRVAFENVLVATDFSPLSEPALLWAKAIARRYGSELYVTHVISPAETALVPPEYWGSTQQAIEEAATRDMEGLDTNLRGVAHKMLLQHGGVWESVSSAIEKFGIDLVVMATHGREGLGRLIMGSVAEEVFRQAPCPVLTVGPKVTSPVIGGPQFRQILLAIDFGPESLAAARSAISLAQEFGTGLTLLNVMDEKDFEPPTDPQVAWQNRIDHLHKVIPPDTKPEREPGFVVKFGKASEQILKVTQEWNADLIVLGAKFAAHGGSATHLASATAHTVVSHATCPVLTVRA